MRIIFENDKQKGLDPLNSPYGNKNFLISPEIDYFLIPKKGRKCRSIYFNDDGAYNLKCALEEDNIRLLPNDLIKNKTFWNNKGLFVKVVYKEPFEFKSPSDTTRHCVFDIGSLNNGYARLIDDELISIATDERYMSEEFEDSKDLICAVNECLFSNEELKYIFECAQYMWYES